MNISHLKSIYNYNYWANRKVWNSILQLSEDDFTHSENISNKTSDSIRDQCLHLISHEESSFRYISNPELEFTWVKFHLISRSEIHKQWKLTEQFVRNYLKNVSDEDLRRKLSYPLINNEYITINDILQDIFYQALGYRSQLVYCLYQLGVPKIDLDFSYFQIEQN